MSILPWVREFGDDLNQDEIATLARTQRSGMDSQTLLGYNQRSSPGAAYARSAQEPDPHGYPNVRKDVLPHKSMLSSVGGGGGGSFLGQSSASPSKKMTPGPEFEQMIDRVDKLSSTVGDIDTRLKVLERAANTAAPRRRSSISIKP